MSAVEEVGARCQKANIAGEHAGRVAGRIAAIFLMLSSAAASEAVNTNFNARGIEPSWHIEIADASITFRSLDGETFTISPTPHATIADGVKTYLAVVDGRAFSLTITDNVCVDTMSGIPHPKTVAVSRGERKLSGCGGDPASLLHGEWTLQQIDGRAVIAESQPTFAFGPDGGVSGNGSCNRFFGSYVLTRESLSLSSLAHREWPASSRSWIKNIPLCKFSERSAASISIRTEA